MKRKGKSRVLASIVSAGMSKFGRREGLTWGELFQEAFAETLERSPKLDPKSIQALFVGTMSEGFENQGHYGAAAATRAGLLPRPAIRTEAACASSGAALRFGLSTIMSGMHDVVLVVGAEKMTTKSTAEATGLIGAAADAHIDQRSGLTFPGFFGLMQVLHMKKYGSSLEDYANISVKNHRNGYRNPKAHFNKLVTLEKALESRIVSWPVRVYDCAPISDGAACLVVAKPEIARRLSDTRIDIIGHGFACDSISAAEKDYSKVTFTANVEAGREAFQMAGLRAEDIDLAEVHDCFTSSELLAYEDLGFCKKGEGHMMVRNGEAERGGRIPINVSGGLKSKGHPVGATGSAQLYEMYLQLNGLAESRQVEDAEIGLTHNLGGCGTTAVVTICARS